MSSREQIKTDKFTIVLFQGGLGDSGSGFNETVNLLKEKTINFLKYNSYLNMENFSSTEDEFYEYNSTGDFIKSPTSKKLIDDHVSNIVTLSKNNPNKFIMVLTRLNRSPYKKADGSITYYGYDSIYTQSKKLIYLIKKIHELDNQIEIILIGHSQGGLVNMEASCAVPSYVKRLISISTPYKSVKAAETLLSLETLSNFLNLDLIELLSNLKDEIEINKYKLCIEKLTDNSYYENLKNKFYNLQNRPGLVVIAGVSGLLYETINPGTNNIIFLWSPMDGLVLLEEQTAIENCVKYILSRKDLPCYNRGGFKNNNCRISHGIYRTCNENCTLSTIYLSDLIFAGLFDFVVGFINNNRNENNQTLMNEIVNALSRKPIQNAAYQNIYNILSSDYSHMFIRYCSETISLIYTWCTN